MESAALPAASDGVASKDLTAVSASAPADATSIHDESNPAGVLPLLTSISVLATVQIEIGRSASAAAVP